MTWLQILSIVAVMATFMGAGIAVAAYFNGKHIREGISQLSDILTEMQRTSEQSHKDTIELLKMGFGNKSK